MGDFQPVKGEKRWFMSDILVFKGEFTGVMGESMYL